MHIVHVEDDVDLADALKRSLKRLGFAGTLVHAETVDGARRIIDAADQLDIVFSEMNLPDGTGLDVIRHVRAHTRWSNTPIVILSGDATPQVLADAYALGANSYVLKTPRARSPLDVVKTMYDHWLRDVELPPPNKAGARETLRQLAKLRERHSRIYLSIAQSCPDDADFWLARALNQTNRSNLLRFIRERIEAERMFPDDLIAAIDESIRNHEQRLAAIERALQQQPPTTREQAGALMMQLVDFDEQEAQLRGVSCMFPISRVAAMALLDCWATHLEIVATWIETNTRSDELHRGAVRLREHAVALREHEQRERHADATG